MSNELVALPGIGSLVVGRYAIIAVRGAGMMGVVLEADDRLAGCRVALKVLRPEVASAVDLRARLEREAHIIASLRSEHVVRVHDFGATEQGLPFFVMELLEGMDLDERLRTVRAFEIDEAVRWIREACDGLAEAHARGVVHRDLKPHNLFLARCNDGRERLKILDFGVSKLTGQETQLTLSNVALGTPMYMSPEQVRSAKAIDARSDVWSLGIVLFELLTGRGPFNGATGHAIAAAIVADPALPLRALRADAPEGLERVLLQALAKDVTQRIAGADELRAALAPYDRSASLDPPTRRLQDVDELTMVGEFLHVAEIAPVHGGRGCTELGVPPMPQPVARTELGVPASHAPRPARVAPAPATPATHAAPPDPKRWMLIAGWGLLVAMVVGALIWLGLDRRSAKPAAAAELAGPAAASAASAAGPELLLSDVLDAARSSSAPPPFEPCILREATRSLPALLPRASLVQAVRDLDAVLASKASPAFVVSGAAGTNSPLPGSGPVLRVAPITPLFPALRQEPVPLLIVTNRKLYVALLGERMLEDVSSAEQQAQLQERLLMVAPGWVVVAEGGVTLSRVREALALLAQTPGSVLLAVPTEGAGPAEPPALAPNDVLACPAHVAATALPLPDRLRKLLQPALTSAGDSCGREAPLAAGRIVRLLARVGAGRPPRDACVESDETGSGALRACALEAIKKLQEAELMSGPERTVRVDLAFGAPRVSALCPPAR